MQFHVTLLCLLKHADVLLLLLFYGLPAAVGCWAPMPSPILRFGDLLFHHLKKVAITRTVPPIVTFFFFFNSIINFICWIFFIFFFPLIWLLLQNLTTLKLPEILIVTLGVFNFLCNKIWMNSLQRYLTTEGFDKWKS